MIEATEFTPLQAALGGALIGVAAVTLMWSLGKIAGISGLLRSAVFGPDADRAWKGVFLAMLVVSAWLVFRFGGFGFELRQGFPAWQLVSGGLLVGYGTALGSGCTSGHGVCGIARLSMRSILATALFMASGIVSAVVIRHGLVL
ncbi:MAG: YeeE/YedE family protein [Xanthomonadales bacterium]|nr:YeeE/YedE family protein [Xanthomonadales bacterium]NNL94420.1 YeeE/YedE family protein [Xanthomonadales bacterium]